jgi:hypothetical protein
MCCVLFVVHVQIVQRMFCVTFPAGSTILLQNAQPAAEDCMYYLAEGQAEVVIMGTVDAQSKQGAQQAPADTLAVLCAMLAHFVITPCYFQMTRANACTRRGYTGRMVTVTFTGA